MGGGGGGMRGDMGGGGYGMGGGAGANSLPETLTYSLSVTNQYSYNSSSTTCLGGVVLVPMGIIG